MLQVVTWAKSMDAILKTKETLDLFEQLRRKEGDPAGAPAETSPSGHTHVRSAQPLI